MPYDANSDLPKAVKDNLPDHAQTIYRKAFNSAWDQYSHPQERQGDADREEVAHKVAWAAVKKEYHKQNGKWVRNQS